MPEPAGTTVGVIGLGAMGAPVARRLAAAGHRLLVHDTSPAAAASVPGAAVAASVGEVVEGAGLLLTCLPSPEAVEAVYAEVAKPGLVAGDLSTIDPELARRLHASLAERGVAFAECPMLGGVAQAEAGELLLVLSGPQQACRRLEPLFGAIARAWRHVGGPGTASLFKTVQNGLGLAQLVAIAEALTLVERAGADPAAFVEVVNAGRGMAASPLFAARAPMMLDPDAVPNGALRIAAKDAALASATARRLGLDASLLASTEALFAAALEAGLGERDISAVIRVVRERADRDA
ncbi:MAG TPA: NAD(P)-dependent oxidoreductase [Geminicoccaceae bacterium]